MAVVGEPERRGSAVGSSHTGHTRRRFREGHFNRAGSQGAAPSAVVFGAGAGGVDLFGLGGDRPSHQEEQNRRRDEPEPSPTQEPPAV